MNKKYIVVVGGVLSGIGKGIATASIAKIMKNYGYSVTAVKIDPYINYDAGTLRPTEHGEVWVTNDGGEIDQDLGSYERFLSCDIPKRNNITTGQVYKEVIDKERAGEYLGKTVQFIPHIPQEIIRRIKIASEGYEITVVEIGGTIGDYENIPYLFAVKSLSRIEGKDNLAVVLVTYLPIPSHLSEMKTKPTQQAIKQLSEHTIFPDIIICRAKEPLDDVRKSKIETYANIETDFVISAPDVESIYEVPLNFEYEKLGIKLLNRLDLSPKKKADWEKWKKLTMGIINPKKSVKVAMVCKYLDIGGFSLKDSYISVSQALNHAGAHEQVNFDIKWIDAKEIEESGTDCLKDVEGIIVPGGFGNSGIEGKIEAINYARKNRIPYLGLCLGMQLALVEYARNVMGLEGANSSEFDRDTPHPVIDFLADQEKILAMKHYGATMRLGAYAANLKRDSTIFKWYKETGRWEKDKESIKRIKEEFRLGIIDQKEPVILERHRHRYEVNPIYIKDFEKEGVIFGGYHKPFDGEVLMEFMELPDHPYFVATQAHPEFKSRLEDPAPLFVGFLKSILFK
ncbi:MAG: CTP synthase [Candidatus Stahlbacteria bacterium]|nr:MAG: CTP synthase [Candidatus Stahlbacteria bacterium]